MDYPTFENTLTADKHVTSWKERPQFGNSRRDLTVHPLYPSPAADSNLAKSVLDKQSCDVLLERH